MGLQECMQATLLMESKPWFLEAEPKQRNGFWNKLNKTKLTQGYEAKGMLELVPAPFRQPAVSGSADYARDHGRDDVIGATV